MMRCRRCTVRRMMRARKRPDVRPVSGGCDADGDQAAAGAADGALGRGLPAASGSRCRRKAAHQDFSRRPAARRLSGTAVTARAIRALSATAATTRPIRTADSTAALTTVRPPVPTRSPVTCHGRAASASALCHIADTPSSSPRDALAHEIVPSVRPPRAAANHMDPASPTRPVPLPRRGTGPHRNGRCSGPVPRGQRRPSRGCRVPR